MTAKVVEEPAAAGRAKRIGRPAIDFSHRIPDFLVTSL
jgi:hypothetical protein